ncbi:hypothetical protein TSH58p_08285 [Azospirillum sp. TSH58]|uniref:hypothetical protein n=1 Tax=Azospirillum sp. TSH58 TaxID=664962 RepID=UPI000D601560|nr:hypothetical protein [Azospirillum sp. TSH58]AWJ83524.1 hypothetical protein TSH58p_08285 [Azospirillum sp. TSH58]PWC65460.1 hypothetical protein TSH58_21100 [Azospirillum sp. TSH58]
MGFWLRKLCGPTEWLIEKRSTKRRRSWRALHIGLDAGSGRIVAATLTDRGSDDASTFVFKFCAEHQSGG